jgi:hypothetical protein
MSPAVSDETRDSLRAPLERTNRISGALEPLIHFAGQTKDSRGHCRATPSGCTWSMFSVLRRRPFRKKSRPADSNTLTATSRARDASRAGSDHCTEMLLPSFRVTS